MRYMPIRLYEGRERIVQMSTNLVNEVSRVFDLNGGIHLNIEIIVRRDVDDDSRERTNLWSSEVTTRIRVEVSNISFDSVKQVQDFIHQFRNSYYFSVGVSGYENRYITIAKKKEEIRHL